MQDGQHKEISDKLEHLLNQHFRTSIAAPNVRIYADPQQFFNDYTNESRTRSIDELIQLSEEVDYYYNDELHTVCFPGFKRDGERSFKQVRHQTMKISSLLHEFIHHWQVMSGGYSVYNLTDEGCCEISTYVLTADIQMWSDYWSYITVLWNLLEATTPDIEKKYEMIRAYNVAKNKTEIANQWYKNFLFAHGELTLTPSQLVRQCEREKQHIDKSLLHLLEQKSDMEVVNDLYRLHDRFKHH